MTIAAIAVQNWNGVTMSDCMQFPDTWEEFEQAYGFEDKKEIYTNGSRLIQSFRVKQWLDHITNLEQKKNKWQIAFIKGETWGVCSNCGFKQKAGELNFCPECGADMRGE